MKITPIQLLFRTTKFHVEYVNVVQTHKICITFYTKDKSDIELLVKHFDLYFSEDREFKTWCINNNNNIIVCLSTNDFAENFLTYFRKDIRKKYEKFLNGKVDMNMLYKTK